MNNSRRCVNVMKAFLADTHNLTYHGVKRTISVRRDDENGFSTDLDENNSETIRIYYSFKTCSEDKMFREFFISLYPAAKEFSDITISFLHEMGHNVHRTKTFSYDRAMEINLIEIKYNTIEELNRAYFTLPDELAATKWAVNWLKKKENRQRAREFEKEFFEAFGG